jgi:hypothetical protein
LTAVDRHTQEMTDRENPSNNCFVGQTHE